MTLTLIGWRGDRLRAPGRIDSPLSREAGFLANNVVFALFAFVVLLGTTFPLFVEAVNDEQLSVGRPFFDVFGQAAAVLLLFLMAVAPVLPWRKTDLGTLGPAAVLAGMGRDRLSVVVAVLAGARGFTPLLAFGLGGFAAGSAVRQLVLATRRQGWRGLVGRANGGMIVHLGVVLVAVGVAASGTYATQRDAAAGRRAQSAVVGGHTVRYLGSDLRGAGREDGRRAPRVEIDGDQVYEPALNIFNASAEQSSGQPIQTPSVRTGPIDDVYLVLLSAPSGDSVSLRVIIQPLVAWLWAGGVLMAVGTVLAAWPGRRRRPDRSGVGAGRRPGVRPRRAPVPSRSGWADGATARRRADGTRCRRRSAAAAPPAHGAGRRRRRGGRRRRAVRRARHSRAGPQHVRRQPAARATSRRR